MSETLRFLRQVRVSGFGIRYIRYSGFGIRYSVFGFRVSGLGFMAGTSEISESLRFYSTPENPETRIPKPEVLGDVMLGFGV